MKKRIIFAIYIIFATVVTYYGCNLKDSNTTTPTTGNDQKTSTEQHSVNLPEKTFVALDQVTTTPEKQPDEQNIFNTQDKRMIIRSGTMSIEVDKYDETEVKIKEIAKKYSGYVTNSNATLNANGKKQGTITLRVPADKFDGVLGEIRQTGKVMNENISGKDVTEEYMDADARLKTQRELEQRLLKLLSEKTARLTDVVEVEQKLSGVRENIEKTQGRMKYLKDQAAYSTLAVSIYEPSLLNTSTGGGFFYEIENGFKKGLNGFTAVLSGLITVLIALLPILIIGYVVIYFVVRFFKKRKKRNPVIDPNRPIAEKSV